jgi:hypothetical protein
VAKNTTRLHFNTTGAALHNRPLRAITGRSGDFSVFDLLMLVSECYECLILAKSSANYNF